MEGLSLSPNPYAPASENRSGLRRAARMVRRLEWAYRDAYYRTAHPVYKAICAALHATRYDIVTTARRAGRQQSPTNSESRFDS